MFSETESSAPMSEERRDLEFADFYRHELGEQVRRASLLVGSPDVASDVVHDAMIGVYDRWHRLDNPAGYLNRAVINGCRDAGRRLATKGRLIERLRPSATDVLPHDHLDDALAALPFNHRAALVLKFYGGWSHDEIATVLACSPNSVGPWVTRGLARLEKELS